MKQPTWTTGFPWWVKATLVVARFAPYVAVFAFLWVWLGPLKACVAYLLVSAVSAYEDGWDRAFKSYGKDRLQP